MTGHELKLQRIANGISGDSLCRRAAISRSKLSNIERGYTVLLAEDAERLKRALNEIAAGRQQLAALAAELGLTGLNTLLVQ